MKVGLQVMGAKELEAELRKLSTRISRRLAREALTFGAEPMRAEAARKAPRRSPAPDLADHIIIAPARTIGRELAAVKVGPEKGFYWGLMQELGTSRHGAQPFLRPAFDNQHTRAIQRVSDELWRALAARGVSRSVFEDGPIESLGGGGLL
jgi:HK97 gp10 family phage protein